MPTELEKTAAASGSERRSLRSPAEIMEIARARESSLSRLLIAYISSGLVFMLLPGTFLGVWNLLQISGRESAGSVSPAWLQAHGHAQVFGWIGSFIFGIGFYSIPKLRGATKPAVGAAWACWMMWTIGVAMRWTANVYGWQWRLLLPISALLELAAFVIFFRAVSQHRPEDSGTKWPESWVSVVISASIGLMLTLVANFAGTIYLAVRGASPALPHALDQRYLALVAWGFLVPFVWGFSTKWMPVFLGLKPLRPKLLVAALAVNFCGCCLDARGMGISSDGALCRRRGAGNRGITDVRIVATGAENPWRAPEFSILRSHGIRLAAGGRPARNRRSALGFFRRHLGRVATCVDGRIHRRDGAVRGPTHSASVRGNAPVVEHGADVRRPRSSRDWMYASRFL